MARRAGRTWGRRLADVTGSLLTAMLVFVATPVVLLTLVGDPLADGLGHQWSHTARLALAGVALVAWVSWLACCTQLTRAVIENVRRGGAGTPTAATLTDRVAARIAVGILAVTTLGAPLALTAGAGAANIPGGAPVAQLAVPVAPPPAVSAPLPSPANTAYVVRPGDTLWTIAEEQLGDGADWGAIAARNLGRNMPGGLRFVDPNRIDAGWTLELPGQAPAPPAPEVVAIRTVSPVQPTPAPAGHIHLPPPRAPEAPVPHAAPTIDLQARPGTPEGAGPGRAGLPELMALGIGAIGCAALARRSRRMKLLRRTTEARFEPPTARAIDTDVLLARFTGVPALDAFEAANCALAHALNTQELPLDGVRVRAVSVGISGVDFWLADPVPLAPAGLTLRAECNVWHMGHDTIAASTTSHPFLPVVLPVGEDDDGTWLIPLPAGSCLPLLGEAADALWRAARPVQEAWSWSDMVMVTADPTVAAAEVRLGGERQILFFGHPASLPAEAARRISVVTTSLVPASDVALLVDRRAATIHPLGRTVRPHLLDAATSAAVDELVHAPGTGGTEPVAEAEPVEGEAPADLALVQGPGTVEVRLLTVTPRLEGLTADLPPNRARRAVELVAYLALHRPDEVTSDRLRTRVLGSADADAAAKTLFNIATAARRAMGTDETGEPLLPAGSRTGHYRVSGAVSVDVHRAASLAAAGSATEDPELAMGLLRAALALVEGEPLANALSGYTWWEAEGHGARIAAVLVNAACDLAALAVSHNLFDLAQWGLEQARLVDPFSEAISRASMQVAAAAGDADRLRREWRECQRRVDELDPGSTPSPRTERLYSQLAKGVLVGATDRPAP